MKNTFVRAFVLMIAVSGFGASTFAASRMVKANPTTAVIMPLPTCAPSDTTYCGLQ